MKNEGRQGALDFMADYISRNPGLPRYRFMLEQKYLKGELLTKEDLDSICPDSELIILEGECHSVWVNSRILNAYGITDETPDPVPGLSYFVRKDGHITGNAFEGAAWPFLFDLKSLTDEQIEGPLLRFIDYCTKTGVSVVFDAGFPEYESSTRGFIRFCVRWTWRENCRFILTDAICSRDRQN